MSHKKYTISEAAKVLDYKTHVLRFYENEFDLDIPRDNKNHRQYTRKEIEQFQYIKELKDKGFNNSQIKEILKSPIIEEDNSDFNTSTEVAVSEDVITQELSSNLKSLNDMVVANFVHIDETINELATTVEELKRYMADEDKDVLVSENAKLKMKLKEKTYELVEIKEKYAKLEQKKFVFKRRFK